MWLAVLAAGCLAAAVFALPTPLPHGEGPLPAPAAVARAAALGRTYAAADVLWLRTVQIIGDPTAERARWPGLDQWVDVTTQLDPAFETPYFFGAALLAADRDRGAAIDRLLARGDASLPKSFAMSMLRGYAAQFGRMETAAAIAHYREAGRRGGPPHLARIADRLEREAQTCASMARDLAALAAEESPERRRALLTDREPILVRCTEAKLKLAAGAFRAHHMRDGTLDELRAGGYVQAADLYPAPGRCWSMTDGRPALGPCTGSGDPP